VNQPIRSLDYNKKLVFNAQKFHIDDPHDLAAFHEVMRKYMDNILSTERYFNKSSELYVYVEWMGEQDFHEEFGRVKVPNPESPKADPQKMQSLAKGILHIAKTKETSDSSE